MARKKPVTFVYPEGMTDPRERRRYRRSRVLATFHRTNTNLTMSRAEFRASCEPWPDYLHAQYLDSIEDAQAVVRDERLATYHREHYEEENNND